MDKKYALLITTAIALIGMGALFKVLFFDSPRFLCNLAKKVDEPSYLFYTCVERVYKLTAEIDVGKKFLKEPEEKPSKLLNDCYIRVLGVIGVQEASTPFRNIYMQFHTDSNYEKDLHTLVLAMGLLGDENNIQFLENILQTINSEQTNIVAGSTVATSIYLLNGRSDVRFRNMLGNVQSLNLTPELITARKIILESKGRARTVSEMILLDHIFRPPVFRTLQASSET